MTTTLFGSDTQVSGAMYVQRMAPVQRSFPLPVVFIHGGMHTGATWETTPDGREGWQTLFVRGGFETLVIDQAWRGRSAPDLTGLNPYVTTMEDVGAAFTCGLRLSETFERGGGRFPDRRKFEYASQLWPDFGVPAALAVGMPALSDSRSLPPLVALLEKLERAVLVTHSQGGDLGWKLALACPDRVAAIHSVEPGVVTPGLDDTAFPDIPICLMWGDNLPQTEATLSMVQIQQVRMLQRTRPNISLDILPDHGICGNGHMMMMEDNNAELADRVMSWLRSLDLSEYAPA